LRSGGATAAGFVRVAQQGYRTDAAPFSDQAIFSLRDDNIAVVDGETIIGRIYRNVCRQASAVVSTGDGVAAGSHSIM
jgi:hypothetical protein